MPIIIILLYLLLFSFSCLILIKAGTWSVNNLTKIAQFLEWKEFVVAFILMAFSTTLPEFFVGVVSALNGVPELSFSNVLGSNIINLTLAVSWLILLIKNDLQIEDRAVVRQHSWYILIISLLPIFLLLDKELSRVDGILLLICLVWYVRKLIIEQKQYHQSITDSLTTKAFVKALLSFFTAVILLLLSAEGVTYSAQMLASANGLSLTIVGALIVAFGTNLPELAFGARAVSLRRPQLALGDLMGAVVINSTWVMGTTVLIQPMKVDQFSSYWVAIFFALLAVLLFNVFIRTKNAISRREGLILAFVYFVFVIFLLNLK